MKIKKPYEPIMIIQKRFGYFPKSFLWRGKLYHIVAVEGCRTVSKRNPFSRVERLYFQVRCNEGGFRLFQDVLANTWHVEKFLGTSDFGTKAA